ncbi:MAG: GGDEF domain-containing protein [Myxococcota bacterium]
MTDDPNRTTNPNKTVITVVGEKGGASKRSDREACLVVIYGEDLGRRIPLGEDPTVIGRSSRCEVQIDQESVSRNHCRIIHTGRGFSVRDLGSTNGTYVNDELIDSFDLRDGDQLKVGRTILKFIVGGNIEVQYHEEIYRLMTMDGLTQVHNKRYFDEMLDRELSRARRYDRSFCVIVFDIDHFKQINDTYGHLAGDSVLRQLGTLVRGHVRRDDILARTGGEEFGIITPEVSLTGALELARKLNVLVDDMAFAFEGTRIDVTMSVGVAQWSPDMQSAQAVLQAADEKLYEAKRTGRNRVCG